MNVSAKGQELVSLEQRVEPGKLAELAAAIGTDSGEDTARLTLYFGPTVAGEQRLIDVLGLDLSRALLAGQAYEWARPLVAGETVAIRVVVADVYEKGTNTFGVVSTEIHDSSGELVQRQHTTFIERGTG